MVHDSCGRAGVEQGAANCSNEFVARSSPQPLATAFQNASFGFNQEREAGRGYYTAVCFHIYAHDKVGEAYQLVDSGFTDWTQQYLSNRKERLLISGMGSERVCTIFGKSSWGKA